MAEKKTKEAAPKKAAKPSLSQEQIEEIVADYMGIHPKYYVYEGQQIKPDIWRMQYDRINFNGWKQDPVKI